MVIVKWLTMCSGTTLFSLCVLCFLLGRGLVPDTSLVPYVLVCVLLQRRLCLIAITSAHGYAYSGRAEESKTEIENS